MRPVSPDPLYHSPLTLSVLTWITQPDRQSKVGPLVAILLEVVQIMSISLDCSLLSSSLPFTRGSDQCWYLDIGLLSTVSRGLRRLWPREWSVLRTFQGSKTKTGKKTGRPKSAATSGAKLKGEQRSRSANASRTGIISSDLRPQLHCDPLPKTRNSLAGDVLRHLNGSSLNTKRDRIEKSPKSYGQIAPLLS